MTIIMARMMLHENQLKMQAHFMQVLVSSRWFRDRAYSWLRYLLGYCGCERKGDDTRGYVKDVAEDK